MRTNADVPGREFMEERKRVQLEMSGPVRVPCLDSKPTTYGVNPGDQPDMRTTPVMLFDWTNDAISANLVR